MSRLPLKFSLQDIAGLEPNKGFRRDKNNVCKYESFEIDVSMKGCCILLSNALTASEFEKNNVLKA